MARSPDPASVVSGLAVAALGLLLLLDQSGVFELPADYAAPAVLATLGAVLLATGLSRD